MRSSHWITASSVVGVALLSLMPHAQCLAQSYAIRPAANPSGPCKTNTATFGFYDTKWRQWPLQPRPEQRDPKTVGADVIPTPPPILEKPLPRAEDVPSKSPVPSEGSGGLPFQGIQPPGTTAPGTTPGPGGGPAGPSSSQPGLLPDLGPLQPDNRLKIESKGVEPDPTHIEPILPGGVAPQPVTPPGTPAVPASKAPDISLPPLKSPATPPDATPSPARRSPDATPDPVPSPVKPSPTKASMSDPLSQHGEDEVATAPQDELPMQANWNDALGPETVRDNQLRSANFEQRATEKGNPLRCALEGYCPVESKEKGRWVAGNPDNQMAYQGQVFCFSSDAARKQFEAAPEKYAPAQGGNDVVLAVEEDRSVPGSVNHSALWHGRLYLFANSATLAAFEGNPARYTEHPERATLQTPGDSL